MSKPTQDDANIMLQLLRWGAAEKYTRCNGGYGAMHSWIMTIYK
ncbi:MAG: hypothetical protein CM15mP64_7450 [Candidatus Neomarinimicrobiota bacterium]|nr:MAG: hypothetical protein CM15mP64_7450 [Candidatus Neomarinimicrobiota bacterium]